MLSRSALMVQATVLDGVFFDSLSPFDDCGVSAGFGPIKALLMGSTSQKITQLARCACLTIK